MNKILVEEKNGNSLYRTRETIIIQGETISVSYSETLEDSEGEVISVKGGLGYTLTGAYYTQWAQTDTAGATMEDVINAGIEAVLAIKDIQGYLAQ